MGRWGNLRAIMLGLMVCLLAGCSSSSLLKPQDQVHLASDRYEAARTAFDYAAVCRQAFIWHKGEEPTLVKDDPTLFGECQTAMSAGYQALTGPQKNDTLNLRFIRAEDVGSGEYRVYLQGQAVYDDIYRKFDDGNWYVLWMDIA